MTEGQFLVDINPNIELPEYSLVLYSLYEKPITELYNITDFNIKPFFIGIDEINFNIPMTRNEVDGQIVRNEIYDMVDGEYYIKLNDSKFFVINKINEKTNDDGSTYKEVSAYSREFELTQKKVVDYKANSRMLYDRNNTMLKDEESGLTIERGILNYIFNHITKGWTIGTVDEKVVSLTNEGISRALNFSNSNLIQVFQELQKTYNCIFKFDTINQVVDVESMLDYELDIDDIANSPQYKGLYISDENFIKNMSKNIEYDKVKTRLYLYGKDNISIQTVTPVGLPYIDNFTTFKNTKFMTQELIDKLNEYEVLVTNANPNFQPKREALQLKHQELEDLYNADDIDDFNKKGLIALQRQLSLVQTEIDTRVENLAIIKNTISSAEGVDLEDLYTQMKTVQSEIDAFENQKANIKSLITTKESQIETKNNEIKAVETEIQAIKDNLSVQATLSPKLIKELDKFIRVETYNDSNFTENNIMELYEEGKKNLAKISQPSIQFDVDVVDFLSIVECQHTWDKFVLGDIVLLENKNIGFSYYVRLVGYEHSPDSNSLRLQFSNTNSFDDATLWIKDLLEQMNNTSSTLDFNKYKWDKTENMQSDIAKMIDVKLEEARQNILNAVGQKHLFDDSGLWLYKENPDGKIDDSQIRAINNTIALTENNWKTVGTAITPKGVVAPSIYGKLGRFALIQANKIEVGGDFDYDWSITQPAPPYQIGQTWLDNGVSKICVTERLEGVFNPDDWKLTITSHIDKETKELDDAITGLDDVITTAFSDGVITNIEANSLSLARDNLVKEANDVKAIATSLEVSTINITTAINNLNTEVNKYVGQSNYPIVVSPTDRINITNVFTALEGSITQLYKTIDEKRAESITVHQILLSNENQSIVTNSDGVITNTTTIQSNIDVFRGVSKIDATIGTPILKQSNGSTISTGGATGITIAKSNPTKTSSGSISVTFGVGVNLPSDSGWLEVPITTNDTENKSYTKKLAWNKAKAGVKGDKGDNAIVGVLSNNSHTVPTDSAGNNGNYTGCSTTMSVYIGGTNDSSNWTITASASNGITGSLSGKTYTVLDMTVNTGYVDLTAKRSGYSDIVMRFNISKNKQGNAGQNSTAYWLVTDVSAINKSQTGVYTPASLSISAKNQVGTSSPSAYSGRFIIAETADGSTFINKYTSTVNESNKSYIPSANIKAIRVSLYLAGGVSNLLDEEIIPIVSDGVKGNDAKIVTIATSHPYFIKNKEGVTPDNITLTPNFQNCIYSKWEYNKNDEGWIDIFKTTPSTSEPWIDNNTKTLTIPKQFNLYKKLIDVPPFRYIRSSQKGGWFTVMPSYRVWGEIKAFVNGVNIAKNKSVTSSIAALSSNPLINLVDDNTTTFTIINNTILTTWEWVRIDLGSIRSDVDSILHYTFHEPDKNRAVPVKLEVSPDNVNWFTIYDSDTSGTYVEPEGGKMFNLIENIDGISYRISSTTGEQDVQTIANLYDSSELAEDMKNTLKQNFYYNRTKITEEEGIEVYDNLGNKVLQVGGIATGSTQTKNAYGFKAQHTDGSFSAITKDGVMRYIAGQPRPYHYVTYVEEVSYDGIMTYQLPVEFRNKGVNGFYAVAVPVYYHIPSGYELEEINGQAVLPITTTDWNAARIQIRSFGVIRNKSTNATEYIQIVVALLAIA